MGRAPEEAALAQHIERERPKKMHRHFDFMRAHVTYTCLGMFRRLHIASMLRRSHIAAMLGRSHIASLMRSQIASAIGDLFIAGSSALPTFALKVVTYRRRACCACGYARYVQWHV